MYRLLSKMQNFGLVWLKFSKSLSALIAIYWFIGKLFGENIND